MRDDSAMAADLSRDLVFRFTAARPGMIPRLKQAGIFYVVAGGAPAFESACRAEGLIVLPESGFAFAEWNDSAGDFGGRTLALTDGLWPGISRGGSRGSEFDVASASRQPWVDANSFRAACLRAVQPGRVPVLVTCRTRRPA